MSSVAPPPFPIPFATLSPLREVQGLYRRFCVLRASGRHLEAEAFWAQTLPPVLTRLLEAAVATESQLEALFIAEKERVENAFALAEVLLPLLGGAGAEARARRDFAPEGLRRSEAASSYHSAPEPQPDGSSGNSASPLLPGIADFIDEMLTQERTPSDPRNSRRTA